MLRIRTVLAILLAVVLICPLWFILPLTAVAEDEQPGQGVEGTPVVDGPPGLVGLYIGPYRVVWYDWYGVKQTGTGQFLLVVWCQGGHQVRVTTGGPEGEQQDIPPLGKAPGNGGCDYNGFVGPMVLDSVSNKPKNKPLLAEAYQEPGYADLLNAVVKLDKYKNVKSIKGAWQWMFYPGQDGQMGEIKFTVTPVGPGNGLPPGVTLPPGLTLPQQAK